MIVIVWLKFRNDLTLKIDCNNSNTLVLYVLLDFRLLKLLHTSILQIHFFVSNQYYQYSLILIPVLCQFQYILMF